MTYKVPATARLTIDVNAVPELANQHVGAPVQVTNNQPVIVERSMCWNANVRDTITEVGYTHSDYGFDSNTCAVLSSIHGQSPDIAMVTAPAIRA